MIDWQSAFNVLGGGILAIGMWMLGRLSHALDRFDDELRTLPEKYVSKADCNPALLVSKEDHNRAFTRIEDALIRIEDKLDGKQDKEGKR